LAPRRALLIGVVVAVLIVVGIAYYVFLAKGGIRSSAGSSSGSGGSGPIRVRILSVEKGVTAVKYKVAEAGGVSTYTIFHVKDGWRDTC